MSHTETAVISGGARGIGRCLARRFLERDYKVFILDIDEEELTHTVRTHLKQYYEAGKTDSAICNLRDVEAIRQTIDKAASFLGGSIGVLVNNGGISDPHWPAGKTMSDPGTVEQWKAYMDTNLTAPFLVSQACLQYMTSARDHAAQHNTSISDAGPCIVHIGSFRALQSDPNQEGYASAKAGLLGLSHSMAVSLAERGIRVNLVAPGRIKVGHECKEGDELGTRWMDLNQHEDVDDHAANRAGRPKDIADAVEYLVNAGFVTGQDLTVDGGATRMK